MVEASGARSVDLFAGSSGAPVGVAFAAAHSERLQRLVIYGGYASGASIAAAAPARRWSTWSANTGGSGPASWPTSSCRAPTDRSATPAVVLHRREDRAIPFELGRELAAGPPDASFVALDRADHYPWFGDSDAVLRATLKALGVDGAAAPAPDPKTDPAPAHGEV